MCGIKTPARWVRTCRTRHSAAGGGSSKTENPLRTPITRHNSQITHHVSHIKCNISNIAHHTSHITHHTSHITPHTSHLTHHTSHITPHTSHITHHTPTNTQTKICPNASDSGGQMNISGFRSLQSTATRHTPQITRSFPQREKN